MIEWVFFDVGSVLFNDDPQAFAIFQRYHAALSEVRPEYTFADMLAEREALAKSGSPWILYELARRHLGKEKMKQIYDEMSEELVPRFDEFHLVNESTLETLAELKRDYRLGIIANQPCECRESLRRRGLLEYFEVVAISEEIDLHKPDPALFQWALDQVQARPAMSVMVGDRRDNDILPAQKVGMRTIWLKWPSMGAKNWQPSDELALQFLQSCDRVPMFHHAANDLIQPDLEVCCLAEIPTAVATIARGLCG